MQIRPDRALHVVVWAYTLLHLAVAALLPLAAHEAHYALYARSPELSYLDHPPLAPWLQSLVLPFSTADFALRLIPIGSSVLAMYLLARLARRVYPDGGPWLEVVTVLLLQGTLVFHGSMTLSPDAPLVPLALASVLLTIRALERDGWTDWLALGSALGLAGLAKYTAVTLALSVLALLLLRDGWRGLFSGRLWLTGIVAAALVSPVVWWNWHNDWLTVAFHTDYQFEDIQRWSPGAFLTSLAEQLLYYSPLLVVGGLATLWAIARRKGRAFLSGRDGVLVAFVLPVLGLYLVTALESRASPHWSMLGWLCLLPLLAHALLTRWHERRALRWLTGLSAVYSGILLLALGFLAVPVGQWPDFHHPTRLVLGWEAAAKHGDRLRRQLPAEGFEGEPVILARNWHHAGLLAWYAPEARVMNLFHDLNPHNLKMGYSDHRTWGVLVYPYDSLAPRLDNLTRDFNCEPVDAQPVRFGRSLVQVFHFYACYSRMKPPAAARE